MQLNWFPFTLDIICNMKIYILIILAPWKVWYYDKIKIKNHYMIKKYDVLVWTQTSPPTRMHACESKLSNNINFFVEIVFEKHLSYMPIEDCDHTWWLLYVVQYTVRISIWQWIINANSFIEFVTQKTNVKNIIKFSCIILILFTSGTMDNSKRIGITYNKSQAMQVT